jgi:hypothetical protein
MKYLLSAAALCSFALLLGSARTLFAGVVMAETSTSIGPDGQADSQVKTIYLQGNKQKIERKDEAAITDLDKGIVYLIDKQNRAYREVPLQALSPEMPGNGPVQSVKLDRTGEIRMIANHPCREYRASKGDKVERVTISACVSSSAPGAREMSEFERKMIARLGGQGAPPSPPHQPAVLMLEKQSVVSIKIPDPSQHRLLTASLLDETRVNQIQLKPLPPETFRPPAGFERLPNRPQEVAPPALPDTAGSAIEAMAPTTSAGGLAFGL